MTTTPTMKLTTGEVHAKLIHEGRKYPVTLEYSKDRITFTSSPFALKDEIKAMAGRRWHPEERHWSVENCPRNQFQLDFMQGKNPYAWFDRELITRDDFKRPLFDHQKKLVNHALTYRYQIWAAEMGTGKSLAAIEVMEKSGLKNWIWVGPKATLPAMVQEFSKWNLDETINVEMMTYDGLAIKMQSGKYEVPEGIIFDESSKVKTAGVRRQIYAQQMADEIRAKWGYEGYVILMSGTPSPKTPVDIWAQAEIAWPGFLREGSPKSLEERLAVMSEPKKGQYGNHFKSRVGWLDQDGLCTVCCKTKADGEHDSSNFDDPDELHRFVEGKNEVELLARRLEGLMLVIFKKDCLELPDKRFVRVFLEPTKKLLRVAQSVVNVAKNTVTGLQQLRTLSDGFMYRDIATGEKTCPACEGSGIKHFWQDPDEEDKRYDSIELFTEERQAQMIPDQRTCPKCKGEKVVETTERQAYSIPCPKDDALIDWMEKCEATGRMLVFAGYRGSVDRCVDLAHKNGWDVFRLDGRGSVIITPDGKTVPKSKPLEYWQDMENNKKVMFVAQPESGGFGLTLVEANVVVFYSNSYKPEYRPQGIDRVHRPGQETQVTIVDLLHLPTDERCLDILEDNRKLEKMVLGEIVGDCLDNPS